MIREALVGMNKKKRTAINRTCAREQNHINRNDDAIVLTLYF